MLDKEFDVTRSSLEAIKSRLLIDPWDHQLYSRGMSISVALDEFEYLRYFKTECIKYCVVDDRFWLLHIEDCKKSLSYDEINSLYKKALNHEPSVEIWLSYLRYECSRSNILLDSERLRNLYEEGINEFGSHALDGPLLWSEYRKFEEDILLKSEGDYGTRLDRIRQLFYRQLALPLAGLSDLLDEYIVWECELSLKYRKSIKEGEDAHKIGHDAWERRKCFELKIQSEFHEMMKPGNMNELWNEYIEFELNSGDPKSVMIVYQRALDDLGYERDDLWINFANYVYQYNSTKALHIYERASRHMPKCTNIWINYLLLQSTTTTDVQVFIELFKHATTAIKGLNNLINLHITTADCLRRSFPSSINEFRIVLENGIDTCKKYKEAEVYRTDTNSLQEKSNKEPLSSQDEATQSPLTENLPFYLTEVPGDHSRVKSRQSRDSLSLPESPLLIHPSCRLDPPSDGESKCTEFVREIRGNREGSSGKQDVSNDAHDSSLRDWNKGMYRVLIYWSKYELKLLIREMESEYINVIRRLLDGYKYESICWLNIIDGIKSIIDPKQELIETIYEGIRETTSTSTAIKSYTLHGLIIWLYELGLSLVSASELAEEYIDYVQTNGVVDDIKKAHMIISSHNSSTANNSATTTTTLSLNNIILKRGKRRRKMETISETSSDSGSLFRGILPLSNIKKSPKLTLRDLEMVTRATWFGCESADPSIAPAVPPNAPMPPPSPVPSRIGSSRFSNSGSYSTPECSPSLKYTRPDIINIPPLQSMDEHKGHFLLGKDSTISNWLNDDTEDNTLFLSRIDEALSEPGLIEIFSKCSGFKQVRFLKKKNCCYVEFNTREDANDAMERNCDNSSFICQISKPTKTLFEEKVLFIKNIDTSAGIHAVTTTLREFFQSIGYTPKDIRFTDSKTDYCFVEFDFNNAAKIIFRKLLTLHRLEDSLFNCTFNNIKFQVTPSIPMIKKNRKNSKYQSSDDGQAGNLTEEKQAALSKTVYITNLSYSTTNQDLYDFFIRNKCPPNRTLVCVDKNGKSRGYGYVEFDTERASMDALLLSSARLDKREIIITKSTKPIPSVTVKKTRNNVPKNYTRVKKKINFTTI